MLVSPVQPSNDESPIVVILSGRSRLEFVNPVHFLNAEPPIVVTLLGITTSVIEVFSINAPAGIV